MGKGRIKISKDRLSQGRKGFTLFELTVVIFLLGILFLLTFPNFRDYILPQNIKRATLGFVGAIKYAQSQAATTKRFHRLMIDVKDNAYWVLREEEKGKFFPDPSRYGLPRNLPAGIFFLDIIHQGQGRIEAGKGHIDFSPTGWAEESAVHFKRKDEELFTIFINALGGRVEIYEGYLVRRKG